MNIEMLISIIFNSTYHEIDERQKNVIAGLVEQCLFNNGDIKQLEHRDVEPRDIAETIAMFNVDENLSNQLLSLIVERFPEQGNHACFIKQFEQIETQGIVIDKTNCVVNPIHAGGFIARILNKTDVVIQGDVFTIHVYNPGKRFDITAITSDDILKSFFSKHENSLTSKHSVVVSDDINYPEESLVVKKYDLNFRVSDQQFDIDDYVRNAILLIKYAGVNYRDVEQMLIDFRIISTSRDFSALKGQRMMLKRTFSSIARHARFASPCIPFIPEIINDFRRYLNNRLNYDI